MIRNTHKKVVEGAWKKILKISETTAIYCYELCAVDIETNPRRCSRKRDATIFKNLWFKSERHAKKKKNYFSLRRIAAKLVFRYFSILQSTNSRDSKRDVNELFLLVPRSLRAKNFLHNREAVAWRRAETRHVFCGVGFLASWFSRLHFFCSFFKKR